MTTPRPAPAEQAAAPALLRRLAVYRQAALALLLIVALALAVLHLTDQWAQVRAGAADVSPLPVLAAGILVILSLTFSLLSWRSMLAGLGSPLPVRVAARIFFIGQLGKYVPGSVWPIVAQVELGAGYGLARLSVATAALLTMAVAMPVALLLGLLAVPALLSADGSAYLWLFLALPLMVLALSPPVLNPLLAFALRLVRRRPLPQRLTTPTILRVAAYAGAAHLLLGLQAWLLARDLGATGPEVLPLAIGAFSLASVVGLLALPAPAGAGVREAVLVLALSPVLPVGKALVVAVASRVLLTVGDLAVATAASRFWTARREKGFFGQGATRGDVERPVP